MLHKSRKLLDRFQETQRRFEHRHKTELTYAGRARIYIAADMQWVNHLSKRRHGWFKRLIDLRNRFRDVQFVVIEVRLDGAATK